MYAHGLFGASQIPRLNALATGKLVHSGAADDGDLRHGRQSLPTRRDVLKCISIIQCGCPAALASLRLQLGVLQCVSGHIVCGDAG